MKRRLIALSVLFVFAARTARAAVSEVPAIGASVGAPSAAASASGASAVAAPTLSPAFAAPGSAPAPALSQPLPAPSPLPAAAALPAAELVRGAPSDGPLRYEPALPPEPERRALPSDKPDGLRQLKRALAARGETDAVGLAEKLYYTDPLTGLPNRAYFVERAARAIAGVVNPTVAMLDMNNFGAVNVGLADLHGVTEGRARADRVLAIAGAALGSIAKMNGVTMVRLGGEEFVALGSRENVFRLTAIAQAAMPPDRILEAAGMTADSEDRAAIRLAMEKLGRRGQPAADFTYGVAELRGRTLAEAVTAADGALIRAKDAGLRGRIIAESPEGDHEWTPPPGEAARPPPLPAAQPSSTREDLERLEARLQGKEKALFHEAAFKDPLTLTRSYDYVSLKSGDWDRRYAGGGQAVLVSARNLKQINDLLGHDAGDLYLRRLGVIMRQTINKARNRSKLDVQEPVRVASKEFLIVGRDAQKAAELVAKAVAEAFEGGRMLASADVSRLRREAAERGQVPEARVKLIGFLRVVSERLDDGAGRADSKAALDRAFERLEDQKRAEDGEAPPPSSAPN